MPNSIPVQQLEGTGEQAFSTENFQALEYITSSVE